MLANRVRLILEYIRAMERGEVPKSHEVLREAKSLTHRLPVLNSEMFQEEYYTVSKTKQSVFVRNNLGLISDYKSNGEHLCVLQATITSLFLVLILVFAFSTAIQRRASSNLSRLHYQGMPRLASICHQVQHSLRSSGNGSPHAWTFLLNHLSYLYSMGGVKIKNIIIVNFVGVIREGLRTRIFIAVLNFVTRGK